MHIATRTGPCTDAQRVCDTQHTHSYTTSCRRACRTLCPTVSLTRPRAPKPPSDFRPEYSPGTLASVALAWGRSPPVGVLGLC